ncbi:hypothetical protein BDW72DRAFT_206398 [Aspergillus terricola var. indicus]
MATINTALVVRVADGQSPKLSKENIDIPRPAENQVLVKVSHAAQNPTDIQSFDGNAFGDGAVLGCDFVGEIVEVGSGVTHLARGDIVAALVWGGEVKYVGAYSQYCLADECISFKLPAGISPEQTSTVPLTAVTAWLALFSKDFSYSTWTTTNDGRIFGLIHKTSVGLYAIQLASLLGFEVVTTCSLKHEDQVRSSGGPDLAYAFDTIGNSTSSSAASQALRDGTGTLCTVRPGKAHTESVASGTAVTDVLVWTAFLKDHSYGEFKWPASPNDHELASELFEQLPARLANGTIKPNNPRVLRGLDAVPDAFQEYRDGKISAYKIVYKL